MPTFPAIDLPVKPRVLIVDDSRIVRATLIKHIEGMFDFREAHDGEEAWETLLVDPNIRVVITDLTMPKLDGYGLLQRIRSSKISRIRDIPVVVVSGSDEHVERERAKAAGATDLITKGIGTAQLLSRLEILSKLVATQGEFERSLEKLVRSSSPQRSSLPTVEALHVQASELLANALKQRRNFVVLNVCVGIRRTNMEDAAAVPPAGVVDAIGQLLLRTVRQSDQIARTGEAEFTLATGSINFDAARCFARRVCKAIAGAKLVPDERMMFVASCGLVSLSDDAMDAADITFDRLAGIAHARAILGLNRAVTGIVGRTEEEVLLRARPAMTSAPASATPDLATLLQWVKDGRQDDVLPHLSKLSAELQPLVELVMNQSKQ